MKKLLLLAMTFVMMFSFTACSGGSFLSEKDILDVKTNPEAKITFEYDLDDGEGKRTIELEFVLYYDKAPSTVANFIKLADEGYYNGKIIDYADIRDAAGEVSYISGGRYKLDEEGNIVDDKKNYCIKGEFKANQWESNDLTHEIGSLVMDRDMGEGEAFDTASTRFYVSLNESVQRNRNYCVFGAIKEGTTIPVQFMSDMSKVDIEVKATKDGNSLLSVPEHNIIIKSVVIDSKGVDYSKAKVAKA